MRMLLVTRRTVPLDRSDEYAAAWRELAAAVEARGGSSWLFVRAGHDDQMVEFLEWRDSAGLADDPVVAEARLALDALAAGATDTLEEAGTVDG